MTKKTEIPVKWASLLPQLSNQEVYITALRFPAFRNLEPGASINFTFPITVLLGRNGTNKSSILHALYGAPKGQSVAEFWFETELDAIPKTNDLGLKQSVVHSYKSDAGTSVECIKARAPRAVSDPDYWEAVKPTQAYGFDARAVRQGPIEIAVLHLDFRGQLPAFDKYFYFPDERHLEQRAEYAKNRAVLRRDYRKQDYLRQRTRKLKKLIETKKAVSFSDLELRWLDYILERKYVSGCMLEHDLFRGHRGSSILFKTSSISHGYSEAFAGSGESAAAMLVHHIEQVPSKTIVLLDEPETSLHPRAQQRMLEFLATKAAEKKLQIVIATHSTHFAEPLPQSAIRVLWNNTSTGRVVVNENISVREALHEIMTIPPGKTVLVEDERAKRIILAGLELQSKLAAEEIRVEVRCGGTSRIYLDIQAHANANRRDLYVVFDGDQKPTEPTQRTGFLPQGLSQLKQMISELTKGNDGKGPDLDFVDAEDATRYIDFIRQYVRFLPNRNPENLVWSETVAKSISSNVSDVVLKEPNAKKRIIALAKEVIGYDEETVFSILLHDFLKTESAELTQLNEVVNHVRGAGETGSSAKSASHR